MAKKNHRKKRRQNPVIPIAIGLSLISIALVWLALPGMDGNAGAADPQGRSVVPVQVNYPAPELALQNLNGNTESLADYRSKVVLVNNWATWCPPCKAEMPVLEAYYENHADEGFMIIAVEAGDPKETVSQFAQSYGLQFQVWLDPNGAALRAFGNGSLPNSYVIDRAGTVRLAWTGEINRAMLEKYVTPLLSE